MLLAFSLLGHIRGDTPEHRPDFETCLRQALEQRGGKRAVAAAAVGGDLIRRGRVCHYLSLRPGDSGQTPDGRNIPSHAGYPSLEPIKYWVVATGIEDHDLDPAGALQAGANVVKGHHFVAQADLILQLRVRRHQVVLPLILKGMAGIVEKSRIRIGRQACELSHGHIKIPPAGVDSENDLKSKSAE